MSRIKIFVVYHKAMPVYKTDCLEPIQTGCACKELIPDFIHDNTGDNISEKNPYFAEFTANYWVWKNYLPAHPDLEYVGFCHYRRFIDFWSAPSRETLFPDRRSYELMGKHIEIQYTQENISAAISGYDVVLANHVRMGVFRFGLRAKTMLLQYINCGHPKVAMTDACNVIKRLYPDYVEDIDSFIHGTTGFLCLNFVMRRNVFEHYIRWAFDVLNEMGDMEYWQQFDNLSDKRIPALIMERLMNVWLRHEQRVNHIKVLERNGILLDWEKNLTVRSKICNKISWVRNAFCGVFNILVDGIKND